MDGVAVAWHGHLRREVPAHVLMIAVMGVAMLTQSALASVVGAAVLVAVSIVCSALSRAHAFLREHVVDLWGMALVLLVFLPTDPVQGHHAVTVSSVSAFALVVLGWGAARVWLALRGRVPAAVAAASGGLTGLGLAAMALFCG